MDRRKEPRIRAYETVNLTVLGDAGYSTLANAIQLSPHGMRLVMDRPIPVNTAIKVVCDDWMALGEVCYCNQERGHYVVGLQVDQVLMGLEALAARNRDVSTEESLPAPHEVEQLLS
jgi:hypothetical protein